MNYNIINEYTDYLKKTYLELFRIVFKNKYKKEETLMFIEKYSLITMSTRMKRDFLIKVWETRPYFAKRELRILVTR